ncbi:hypothetical protein M569_00861, partial [Genlisea aurea]
VDVTWGGSRGQIHSGGGEFLTLALDAASGSGFQSRNEYVFGKFEAEMKLVAGNSAGTVTSLFLCSGDSADRDEMDIEFLGNSTGDPYTVHTNIYTRGEGKREQQFRLWFDPTHHFHTYSLLWTPRTIIFSVDNVALREFKNMESKGVPFPRARPMRLYSSIWNADDWATRGGLVKTDWSHAPFIASYRRLTVDGCRFDSYGCGTRQPSNWIRSDRMVYDYCTDHNRFPQGLPLEC